MEPADKTDQTDQADLAAALDRLWTRFLPEIGERVSILESATKSMATNSLSIDQREAAGSAAHKLAGVLGTFNLHRGTALARELELVFHGADPPDPDSAARLASLAAELRSVIDSRK